MPFTPAEKAAIARALQYKTPGCHCGGSEWEPVDVVAPLLWNRARDNVSSTEALPLLALMCTSCAKIQFHSWVKVQKDAGL